jgi:hypothetical protein
VESLINSPVLVMNTTTDRATAPLDPLWGLRIVGVVLSEDLDNLFPLAQNRLECIVLSDIPYKNEFAL